VVHRELTASDLDVAALLDLIRNEDPLGVVSVYVDMPVDGADRRADIELKNQVADLERRVAHDGRQDRQEALRAAIGRVMPAVEHLLDPRTTGRGGAAFSSLSTSEVTFLATPLPFASRVVLDSRPFIQPLLEQLEEGRPAGVVLTSARAAELFDWRFGELRRLMHVTREFADDAREHPGPLVVNPARAQLVTPRDQRSRRERDRQMRWMERVAAEVFRLADEHDWERILISGDERLTTPLVEALPERLRGVVLLDPRHLHESDHAVLAADVAERLRQDRAGRNADLSRRVRAAALGAQRGALGLSEVVAALNEGRAEHVIYDSARRYSGGIGPDGSLFADTERLGLGKEEPRLLERIVERALHTGARVTPLDGSAAGRLADADGIAALLRW
jgi:Bacterial archaeo-eukaryotic release factor family 10